MVHRLRNDSKTAENYYQRKYCVPKLYLTYMYTWQTSLYFSHNSKKLSASMKIKISREKFVLQMCDQIPNKMYCARQLHSYRKDNEAREGKVIGAPYGISPKCSRTRFDSTHMSALEGFLVAVIKDALKNTNTKPITTHFQMHLKNFKVQ